MELGPADAILLREAARNELYRCNFNGAQALLNRALETGTDIVGERIKLIDLQMQVYGRELEYQLHHDRTELAEDAASRLANYLSTIKRSDMDRLMVQHLTRYRPALLSLNGRTSQSCAQVVLDAISAHDLEKMPVSADETSQQRHLGRMKRTGHKPAYGFLESETCPDTYTHIGDVTPDIWEWMLGGGVVEFERLPGERGRAVHIKVCPE